MSMLIVLWIQSIATISAGLLAQSLTRRFQYDIAIFALGASLAPFWIALHGAIAFSIGAPFLLIAGLSSAATLATAWKMRVPPGSLNPFILFGQWSRTETACLCATALTAIIAISAYSSLWPVDADALQYLLEAQFISSKGFPSGWPGISGDTLGQLRGDAHHPAWPLALAAQLAAIPLSSEMSSVFLGANLSFLSLAFGFFALGRLAGAAPWHLFAGWVALLMFSNIEIIVRIQSRDAFRLIPLLALVSFLLLLKRKDLSARRAAIAIFVTAYSLLAGHSIGLILAPFAGALLLLMAYQKQLVSVFSVSIAFFLGSMLASEHYIRSWLTNGTILGSIAREDVARGTVYLENILNQNSQRILTAPSLTGQMKYIWLTYPVLLSVSALAIAMLIFLIRGTNRKAAAGSLWLLTAALLFSLPNFGAMDFLGMKISDWFLMNPRYSLHLPVFLALFIAATISSIGYPILARRISTSLVAASFIWFFWQHPWVSPEPLRLLHLRVLSLQEQGRAFVQPATREKAGKTLTDLGGLALDHPFARVLIFHPITHSLLRATDELLLREELARLDIDSLLFWAPGVERTFNNTPLGNLIEKIKKEHPERVLENEQVLAIRL